MGQIEAAGDDQTAIDESCVVVVLVVDDYIA